MGKTKSEIFIKKTLKTQRNASDKARLAYEKTGDPEIVIKFIKRSKAGSALQETWINTAIQGFIRNDRSDLLKKAFLPRRGENKETRRRELEGMMFFERIEKQRRAGKSLKEACITESERTGGGISEKELTALTNKYQVAKKIKTEITIQETAESFVMTAFPAKIKLDDLAVFGTWTITFPKK